MHASVKWVFALFTSILAFLANPYGPFGTFWPPAVGIPIPTGAESVFFVLLNIFEAVSLGIALTMLMFDYPRVALAPLTLTTTRKGFLGLVWILGNWWIHDALHVHVGQQLPGLLFVEYGFHVTTMAVAVYLLILAGRVYRHKK